MSYIGTYSVTSLGRGSDLVNTSPQNITRDTEDGTQWSVRSDRTGRRHTVVFLEDPQGRPIITCTCQHGTRAGGKAKCYHAAAVELLREKEEER